MSNSMTRRTLCIGVGATAAMVGLGALRYAGSVPLVRPPGGQDEENLVSRCVHCYRCIEACPEKVIVAAPLDAGLLNMRTPQMEFSDCYPGQLDDFRYCDFCAERNGGVPQCVAACPSGALQLPVDYDANREVIGVAELDQNLCIAYRSSFCAFCHDVCRQVRGEENAAIYYQNADEAGPDDTRLPMVDPAKCNGCGACEAVCVSTQVGSTLDAAHRAIVVKPLEG